MMLLLRSIGRALLQAPGWLIGVASLIAVAITVYAGTYISVNHVEDSIQAIYQELRLFNIEIRTQPTSLEGVPPIEMVRAQIPGIAAAAWRLSAIGSVELPGQRVAGAVVHAVPPDQQPTVSAVRIVRGSFLSSDQPNAVVIDKTSAQDFSIGMGTRFTLRVSGREALVYVRGIGIFPEFLMASIDDGFSVPTRSTVVAVAMSQDLVKQVMDTPLVNSLILRLAPGARRADVLATARTYLNDMGVPVVASTFVEDQYSVNCSRSRLAVSRDFLPTIIAIFDILAFLVLFMLMRRTFQSSRREFAVQLSLGVSPLRILAAWVVGVGILVAAGALAGVGGAVLLAKRMDIAFVEANGLPWLAPNWGFGPLAEALLLTAILMLPAIAIPLLPILQRTPGSLFRDAPDEGGVLAPRLSRLLVWLSSHRSLGIPERMGFRNIVRRPAAFLSATTCLTGMLVVSTSMYLFGEGLERGVADFLRGQRWDFLIRLASPMGAEDVSAFLAEGGVSATAWEPLRVIEGTLRSQGLAQSQRLVALPIDSVLRTEHGIIRGRTLRPGKMEVLINLDVARSLGVDVGHTLTVSVGDRKSSLEIVGIMNSFTMNQAFLELQTLEHLLGRRLPIDAVLVKAAPSLHGWLNRQLQVATVIPQTALAEAGITNFQSTASFVEVFGHLAAVVSLIIMLAIIRVNSLERFSEYGLLWSLGFSPVQMFRCLLTELAGMGFLALGMSLPLTKLATWIFQRRIMNISFWVPINNSNTHIFSFVGPAVGLLILSVLPALYYAVRVPIADSLRCRTGND